MAAVEKGRMVNYKQQHIYTGLNKDKRYLGKSSKILKRYSVSLFLYSVHWLIIGKTGTLSETIPDYPA